VPERVLCAPRHVHRRVLEEGTVARSPHDMLEHFYSNCRQNYQEPRLPARAMFSNDDAFELLVHREVGQLQRGAITAKEFMLRFKGIKEGIPGVVRRDVEDLFDQLLKSARGPLPLQVNMVLTAAIGVFDLSSTERTFVRNTTTYSMGGATNYGNGGYYTAKPVPAPLPWCKIICNDLDIGALRSLDINVELGMVARGWFITGLCEAVERLSKHGSFKWLRIIPYVEEFAGVPDTDVSGQKKQKATKFRKAAEKLLEMVEMTVHGAKELRATADTREGDTEAQKDMLAQADSATNLAHCWLRALVKYSPDMDAFQFVVTTPHATEHMDAIGGSLRDKTATYDFVSAKEIVALTKVAQATPTMIEMGATLAAGLLNNEEADGFPDPVLTFVATVTQHLMVRQESGAHTEPEPESDTPTGAGADDVAILAGQGQQDELTKAAKDWIRRRHADRPARETVGYGQWAQVKTLTEAELLEEQWKGLQTAIQDIDKLMKVPVLAANGRTIMFELTRCYMFKGNLQKVLEACCTVVKGQDQFGVDSAHFELFLTEKLEQVVRDVVSQILDYDLEIRHCLRIITSNLRRGGPLSMRMIYQLAATMSVPTRTDPQSPVNLDSILRRQLVWKEIIGWCGAKTEWDQATPLGGMLHHIFDTLLKTAQGVYRQDIHLETLHAVLKRQDEFLEFLSDLDIDCADQTHIEHTTYAIVAFDKMLEHTQCYVTSVCSCGVKIDAEDLRRKVDGLRENYATTPLYMILDAFEDVECAGSIPWLFSLQNSELFLSMWRSVGADVCRKILFETRDQAQRFQHTDLLLRVFAEFLATDREPQPHPTEIGVGTRLINFRARDGAAEFEQGEVTAVQGEGPQRQLTVTWDSTGATSLVLAGEFNTTFTAFRMRERVVAAISVGRDADLSLADKEDRMRGVLQGAILEERDAGPSEAEQISEITLSQSDVALVLLPQVKQQWRSLYLSVRDFTIPTEGLRQRFGNFKTMDVLSHEINLLAATGEGNPRRATEDAPAPWIPEAEEKLDEYLLLERLTSLIPAILHVRKQLESLCAVPVEDDPTVAKLEQVHTTIQNEWSSKTLRTLSELVAPVKGLFQGVSDMHLDFFANLHKSDLLVDWLLNHSENDKFTSLLQVCRPCVDDPILLKAIASLVQVRVVMLNMLYMERYTGLEQLLHAVRDVDMGRRGATLAHLENVQLSFEGLLDVFEKQTRSPGIKSCYDLNEIRTSGEFVLQACSDRNAVLSLQIQSKTLAIEPEPEADDEVTRATSEGSPDTVASTLRVETYEYMQDLRSHLIMTEVPEEIAEEMPIAQMIESYVEQLQVFSDMRDALHKLYTSGHFSYQGGYTQSHKFALDGLPILRTKLAALEQHISEWDDTQREMRSTFYFLNYFRMREILRLAGLLEVAVSEQIADFASVQAVLTEGMAQPQNLTAAASVSTTGDVDEGAELTLTTSSVEYREKIEQLVSMGFESSLCIQAMKMTSGNVERGVTLLMEGAVDASSRTAVVIDPQSSSAAQDEEENNASILGWAVTEFRSMLHLASSKVPEELAVQAMRDWASSSERETDQVQTPINETSAMEAAMQRLAQADPAGLLQRLGELLGNTLASHSCAAPQEMEPELEVEPEPELDGAASDTETVQHAFRKISVPDQGAFNRSDMLLTGEDFRRLTAADSKRLPVWVTCAQSPNHVIDVVMSVFARRGRLPEPSEILFCTGETTLEEIELLIQRFLRGRPNDRGEYIFTLADVHSLSYTKQCAVVDKLQSAIAEQGTDDAATLLIVSGRRQQVVLNSLSQQSVELPPMHEKDLCKACTEAFQLHCGDTKAVTGTINGCGKSFHIMSYVAERQKDAALLYRRLPFREASSASSMVAVLSSMSKTANAVHLDIGHIIPASANTVLFELLVVGVIRDMHTCRVYNRRKSDVFMLEIPNSIGDKTAMALRIGQFLPTREINCSADTLQLQQPTFRNATYTQLRMAKNSSVEYVCKYLRAFKGDVLKARSGETFKLDYDPFQDEEAITSTDCFDLLIEFAGIEDTPSFNILSSFVRFMFPMLQMTVRWQIMNWQLEDLAPIWHNDFKHSFVHLLIATSKDFSTRSVPQGDQRRLEVEDQEEDTGAELARTKSGSGGLARQGSAARDATHALQQGAVDGGAAPLVALRRVDSREGANRFDSMTSWENSDHPIAVWLMADDGYGVDGVNILSLNPRFVDEFINRSLKEALGPGGVCYPPIEFNRNWNKLKNAEAMDILRHASGWSGQVAAPLNSGYVMTVDNLLKMLSISLRVRFGMPVIVMGETGCGKSSLMTAMCAILGWKLHTLNIHGGMEDSDIIEWMDAILDEDSASTAAGTSTRVVFLDEVNTCNSMGLFKEMICDGYMNGRRIPDSIKVIAACNPYRLRLKRDGDDEGVGLVFEHSESSQEAENVGTGIKDPLSELVYRVHPLPESMTDFIFDFGALSDTTERMYIGSMIRNNLSLYVTQEEMVEELGREEQLAEMARSMGVPTDGLTREEILAHVQQTAQQEAARAAAAGEDVGAEYNQWGYAKAHNKFGEFVETFTELVCAAQEFVREYHGGERSSASLRDVARCIKVFRWFGEHFAKTQTKWTLADFFSAKPAARRHIRSAMFMSLAYCYHSRLPRSERAMLRMRIADAWRGLQKPPTRTAMGWLIPGKDYCAWLQLTAASFLEVLDEVQKSFVSNMKFPEGIALNEALCENVFMILVSVLNQIPIFIIGKPGTSKSLAVELVQTNLQGKASESTFLRALPAVQTFSYQCSPLSTSEGIEQAFAAARRYRVEAANTVVIVLLDEVGLAEQSPHLPLKVLHKTLDEAGSNESVVGISNWALDPAKMNRAVHLYRQEPTVEDLALTAEGMVNSANLKGHLQAVAKAFFEVYRRQKQTDFWGMREFYSTVRFVNRALKSHSALNKEILMTAVLRNYGGRPSELELVVDHFFREMLGAGSAHGVPRAPVLDLVTQNIAEPEARHLMLLTRNNAALGLLFDHSVLAHDRSTVVFGSDFPLDKTDLQVCLNIQRVKNCMASGVTLVLVHCEMLFESMYDLLNQHYTSVGDTLWVRLAFGTHSRLCPIDPKFRVVVVVEKTDAYTKLAAPLLNRFEKQVMERRDVMLPVHTRLARQLKAFVEVFATRDFASMVIAEDDEDLSADDAAADMGKFANVADMQAALCGFHSDILCSLVLTIVGEAENGHGWYGDAHSESGSLDMDKVYDEAVYRLMWAATPEAVCRVAKNDEQLKRLREQFRVDIPRLYFSQQSHSNLPAYCDRMRELRKPGKPQQTLLMTYSPLFLGAADALSSQKQFDHVSLCVLHDLSSERDLEQHIAGFFDGVKPGSLLLVQCDPRAASLRRVEHAKYMCEKALADFMQEKGEQFFYSRDDDEPEPESLEPEPEGEADAAPIQTQTGKVPTLDVILLVHLPRAVDCNFCIDFDTRWNYAFVDSIVPASDQGLLDVEEMMGRTMTDIVNGIDLSMVLAANFRFAVARLVYLYERSNEDVRNQIGVILQCLKTPVFVDCVRNKMIEMVEAFKLTLDLSGITDADSGLALAGTFQEALHHQITDALAAMFAIVLSHMDRNGGLNLFANESMQSLWTYLFIKTFDHMSLVNLHKAKQTVVMGSKPKSIEVPSDGSERSPFQSKFPFSFFIFRLLESMKEATVAIAAAETTQAAGAKSTALQSQFEMLSLEQGLAETLSKELLHCYVYDFACMQLMTSDNCSKDVQTEILWRVLELAQPDEPIQCLSDIHSRFWDCENRVVLYCQLLDAVPAAVDPIREKVLSASVVDFSKETGIEASSAAIDIVVIKLVLNALQLTADTDYGDWCTQMDLAKPAVLSLLSQVYKDVERSHPVVRDTRLAWEKLELYDHFVRNIATPLALTHKKQMRELTMHMVDALAPMELRSRAAFRVLISMLCKTLVDVAVTSSQKEEPVRKLTSNMMELYIFDVCFNELDRIEDTELLADFVELLAGRDLTGETMAGISSAYGYVIRSEAGRIALLSAVVHIPNEAQKIAMMAKIQEELAASVAHYGFLDTPFCMSFLAVLESKLNLGSHAEIEEVAASIDVSQLSSAAAPVHSKLQVVARVRQTLLAYGRKLAVCVDPQDGVAVAASDLELLAKLQAIVDPLLVKASGIVGPLRSMRMFLLKTLERQRGVQFVRSAMQQPPLKSAPWLGEWVEDKEVGLVRFMGQNKLPQHNPLAAEALFGIASSAIGKFMNTGQLPLLDAFVVKHKADPKLRSALATSLFHEVHLLKVLPNGMSQDAPARMQVLLEWLSSSGTLAMDGKERQLLMFCAGGPLPTTPGNHDAVRYLTLDQTSSPEKIITVRLLVHIAAGAASATVGDQMHFFQRLMLAPDELKDNFWPTMPDDPLYMAMQALMGAGAETGANRWYTCPNGHPFAIGQCGGAMEESKCPACGEKIGGMGHNLVGTNKVIGKTEGGDDKALFKKTILSDNSDKNYCLRTAAEETDKHYSCRGLDARTTRAIRVMMHGVMLIGHAIGGDDWWTQMKTVINENYTKTDTLTNPAAFLLAHLRQNIDIVKELLDKNDDELALLLHKTVLVADGSDLLADDGSVQLGDGDDAAGADGADGADDAEAAGDHPAPNTVNVAVTLSPGYGAHSDAADGPLQPGQAGMIVEYGGMSGRRFNVRAPDRQTWWYDAEALLVAQGMGPRHGGRGLADEAGHPSPNQTGIRVRLAADYEVHSDAGDGPLRLGDVGEVLEFRDRETHQWRCKVVERDGAPVETGKDWWYDTAALLVRSSGGGGGRVGVKTLAESASRVKWEKAMYNDCLADIFRDDGLAERLHDLEAHFCQAGDEGAVFKEELLERYDVSAIDAAERQRVQPGLWLYKRPFSFEHFEASLVRCPCPPSSPLFPGCFDWSLPGAMRLPLATVLRETRDAYRTRRATSTSQSSTQCSPPSWRSRRSWRACVTCHSSSAGWGCSWSGTTSGWTGRAGSPSPSGRCCAT
jgi:MoxR-like ATPase